MRRALSLALLLATLSTAGCATLLGPRGETILTKILAVTLDGQQILETIDSVVQIFLNTSSASPKFRADYELVAGKARSALNLVVRLSRAGKELNTEQIDVAFADFKAAYTELTSLLGQAGLTVAGGTLSARPDTPALHVPPPLALTFSAKAEAR
jgi:hypothetical protein